MKKRALPIEQKNMVYNEWGAIIRHQDEMDKALRVQEAQQKSVIKDRYRQDLENQKLDLDRKKKEDKLWDARIENDVLDY